MNVTLPVGVSVLGETVAVKVTPLPNVMLLAVVISVVVVLSVVTVTDTAEEVLPEFLLSPPYTAVIECIPTARVEVVKVATPDPFSVPVPRVVVPSINVTLPVGVSLLGETVAVKVTLLPTVILLAVVISAVVVLSVVTVTETAGEVLPEFLLSPP
jgi:hypothetical protein